MDICGRTFNDLGVNNLTVGGTLAVRNADICVADITQIASNDIVADTIVVNNLIVNGNAASGTSGSYSPVVSVLVDGVPPVVIPPNFIFYSWANYGVTGRFCTVNGLIAHSSFGTVVPIPTTSVTFLLSFPLPPDINPVVPPLIIPTYIGAPFGVATHQNGGVLDTGIVLPGGSLPNPDVAITFPALTADGAFTFSFSYLIA